MSALTNTYRNPILPGFNPDPSITYVEGQGYFLCTSSFEFFPGLPIYHSRDLVNWTLIGHAINRRSQVDMRNVPSSAGLWAPTIRYWKGRFYVTCGCFYKHRTVQTVEDIQHRLCPRGFYVSTDDIFANSWTDAVHFDEMGFDQDLFFDDDNRVYLTVSNFEYDMNPFSRRVVSYTNEIDLATGRSLGKPVLATRREERVSEGCHILKKDGKYYLFVAEGGTASNHQEWVYRSDSPLGPWEQPPLGINPILCNGAHADIQNTGHLDLIQGEHGKWWAVFLAVRPTSTGDNSNLMLTQLGREPFLAPAEWIGGWPLINGGNPVELVGKAEGLTFVEEPWVVLHDFSKPDLDLSWYSLRTPLKPCYSLSDNPGHLSIYGSCYTLTDDDSPSALFQRQTGFTGIWSTEMEFSPEEKGEEAGTVLWLHKESYVALAVRERGNEKTEVVFKCVDGENTLETNIPLMGSQSVTFKIVAQRTSYQFIYQQSTGGETVVGTVASSSLKPLFTGAHFGLYAQGAGGRPCLKPACFKYAEWKRT